MIGRDRPKADESADFPVDVLVTPVDGPSVTEVPCIQYLNCAEMKQPGTLSLSQAAGKNKISNCQPCLAKELPIGNNGRCSLEILKQRRWQTEPEIRPRPACPAGEAVLQLTESVPSFPRLLDPGRLVRPVKEFGGYGRVRLLHLPGQPAGVDSPWDRF